MKTQVQKLKNKIRKRNRKRQTRMKISGQSVFRLKETLDRKTKQAGAKKSPQR